MKVKEIFNSDFAIYYEKVINRLTSPIQIDKWRKTLVKGAVALRPDAVTVVDCCSGAGNVGKFYLKENPRAVLINCDISRPLLGLAKENFATNQNVFCVCSDNRFFPIKDRSVDILFSSFCVRNSPEPLLTVEEAKRVIKKGGVWAILDFFKLERDDACTVANNFIFRFFMKLNGIVVPSYSEAINYLFESIENFYTAREFRKVLLKFGFTVVKLKEFMGGIASVLIAIKEEV
ncbi:class I SAM-dependent methyltransferase [Phorcysia thermohydrogeniphila]|uniref:Demethylmenaquinone methyltransferase/2-methoxy-6-polyprenyl-1,4-benzoquinol methylase n=1 Tax=Phorcysia thermohydrogeniphila TaxID=936138 RepID=A0A4R1GEZ0_9BACT|nr:class I SAM-dependent methyltransferase [Phorcysia thermohydrogeniphila]TCK06588.1 demethylmenaquinone methyltransferase/2-methoxy-6-polyprenyl-1,4-benzoquinol methylase [Phorcysia thermohydrogeniphila]